MSVRCRNQILSQTYLNGKDSEISDSFPDRIEVESVVISVSFLPGTNNFVCCFDVGLVLWY